MLAYRWLKIRLLWRLRNRLIVTYIFIGVIPAILLIAMYFISTYLFAGQFANFVVTSELQTQLRGMEGVNTAVAGELAQRASTRQALSAESLQGLRTVDFSPATQVTCVWVNDKPLVLEGCAKPPFSVSTSLQPRFSGIVSDNGDLFLRTAIKVPAGTQSMTVISSQPLNKEFLEQIAAELGQITLYGSSANSAQAAEIGPVAWLKRPRFRGDRSLACASDLCDLLADSTGWCVRFGRRSKKQLLGGRVPAPTQLRLIPRNVR